MSPNEHWDGPDTFESSRESSGHRSHGCITILLLMALASLALCYPWFGIPLLIIVIAIYFFPKPVRR